MPTKAERGDMIGGDGVPMRGETRPSSHCNGMCRADIGRITRFPLGDGIELIAIGNEQNSVCDVIVGMGGSGARGRSFACFSFLLLLFLVLLLRFSLSFSFFFFFFPLSEPIFGPIFSASAEVVRFGRCAHFGIVTNSSSVCVMGTVTPPPYAPERSRNETPPLVKLAAASCSLKLDGNVEEYVRRRVPFFGFLSLAEAARCVLRDSRFALAHP